MSIFEIIMLICFGLAWPFSIFKSYKSQTVKGKSLFFLIILIFGYISGILHKIFYNYDIVIFLYAINLIMVSVDALLFMHNKRNEEISD